MIRSSVYNEQLLLISYEHGFYIAPSSHIHYVIINQLHCVM